MMEHADYDGNDALLQILIIDFLDSYTHNIPAFVKEAAKRFSRIQFIIQEYTTLTRHDVIDVCYRYHGIILSPGPGTVDCVEDLGTFVPALLASRSSIPIYGICLGFQAICQAFGGYIKRLSLPHHGLRAELLGPEMQPLNRCGTRYHSLEVVLPKFGSSELRVQAVARNFDDNHGVCVMEVEHRILPIWGVQYHPESIYSQGCHSTVQPFLNACRKRLSEVNLASNGVVLSPKQGTIGAVLKAPQVVQVLWDVCSADLDLADLLSEPKAASDFILLDSSSKGEWDILAASSSARLFQYSAGSKTFSFTALSSMAKSSDDFVLENIPVDAVWEYLRQINRGGKYIDGPPDVPFWGGFIGYMTYELGLAQLGLDAYPDSLPAPDHQDLQFLWSMETVVYHKTTRKAYVISLPRNDAWVRETKRQIEACSSSTFKADVRNRQYYKIEHPGEEAYLQSIEAAHEEIRAGNSYELCLTAPAIARPLPTSAKSSSTPSNLFYALREQNPAAYMSHIQLPNVSLISASPEEFMSFDADTRVATMKPMKGTHAKRDQAGNAISLEAAKQALHSAKVIAENLMIVDLVRNDLSKVSQKVTCPVLFEVEEIENMYQLTSTVQAEVEEHYDAWDLIKAAIPPGSMTGAPKRRSCEILQNLEGGHRGLYSGIIGYVDVRGHCKMSVSIRNACKYSSDDYWTIAAGGAITALSDPAEEWQERQLKAQSVSRVFEPDFEVLETMRWNPEAQRLLYWDAHFKRLMQSLGHFGFDLPLVTRITDSKDETSEKRRKPTPDADRLRKWILSKIETLQPAQALRLSLLVSVYGQPSLNVVPITATPPAPRRVRLDPSTLNINHYEPFVSHKTTKRNHYASAKQRAGDKDCDEVLLFRPSTSTETKATLLEAAPDDLLTEGSYTNVAVFNEPRGVWVTPRRGCLPGIMREHLLRNGEIELGDTQRRMLTKGTRVRLFNSVRDVFEGIVIDGWTRFAE